MKPSNPLLLLAVAAGIAVGAGGAVALTGGDGERAIAPIAVPAAAAQPREAPSVVVDDGVPTDQAEAVAAAAAEHVAGTALSVDTDDGLYEVEVQRADGAIVEVMLDGTQVIDVETGDGDG